MTYAYAEERCFFRWAVMYQRDMSFDEFKRQINAPTRQSFEDQNEDENKIIDTVKNILDMRI